MNQTDEKTVDLWWAVPGVLAGMAAPHIDGKRKATPGAPRDAFADDLPLLWEAGIRAVVCMTNSPELAPVYEAAGFSFHFMPVEDGEPPTPDQFRKFTGFVTRHRATNQPVAVHCVAGIGRTGTALAGYLMASEGISVEEAITRVRSQRLGAVETGQQMQFLYQMQGMRR